MIEMEIADDELVIKVRGWDRIWALKNEVRILLSDIEEVRRAEPPSWFPSGLRCCGTCVPGVITAGSYWRPGFWSFWSIRHPKNAIVIETTRGFYRQLVVEPANPDATLGWLHNKIIVNKILEP